MTWPNSWITITENDVGGGDDDGDEPKTTREGNRK